MGLRHASVASIVAALALGLGACGGDSGDEDAGNPASRATDYAKALADAPPKLAAVYDQGNELLDGGKNALEAQLDELRGYPVVVNVWASWCGPCRFEFPYLQSQSAKRGERIAFLGVDVRDSEDAARTFLDEFPVPYPSFTDPDDDVRRDLHSVGLPSTAFYDATGELAYLKQGPYESEDDLADDIDRYAR
jgi:cytochrome c biogenesis protein CcmG, thiol:disulfide interchange protein DsbE